MAATISAATSVVQPKPIAIRIDVRISGIAAGMTTCRITCHRDAPIDSAAWTCSCDTERTPACALIAIGAKHAR